MNKKIIAVDFDGTLCVSNYPNISKKQRWIHKLILRFIIKKQKQGCIIILNTLREKDKGLQEAVNWLQTLGFYPDYINSNYPPNIFKYGESRKIGCTLNIDDRNIGFFGWLLRLLDK